ncbi:MAG: hypoxanthine phosphoribosyltransferase [Atribacterota bacterium]|jgi:hypoxanthine phosphoribosyltransferase|nr:hypoxanthine phosphoribosyltransferase [Atribacterota bacterium]MDD3030765.1 hypoxanthine phosphoribosyltransferase [Atribacterota bacterium]MDD3640424.1 hypoxanthine phosphoribosyltransferase [Atribacterota bacterium]MDD4288216.1 hypoxanthine phosphoribosyltransferase [Atribacterota bacterium]MDD4764435.1 hypoxanthine phosphoribosyltransferase [Atribacterota bacterium]
MIRQEQIEEILIPENQIQKKIQELGNQISRDYKGKQLICIGVLRGAIIFLADLARNIKVPIIMDFMDISSYGTSTESSGVVRIIKDLDENIEKKDVLIIEDIVDTGLTLDYLIRMLKSRNPASLKVCALLNKVERRRIDVPIDYCGFDIPDKFVVGYGLDFNGLYRNIPYILVLKSQYYQMNDTDKQ